MKKNIKHIISQEKIGNIEWTDSVIKEADLFFDLIGSKDVYGEDYIAYLLDAMHSSGYTNKTFEDAESYYTEWLLSNEQRLDRAAKMGGKYAVGGKADRDKEVDIFSKKLEFLQNKWDKKGVYSEINILDNRLLELELVEVKNKLRRSGLGTKFMEELTDMSDKNKFNITLLATWDYGTDENILKSFYEKFGFVKTKRVPGGFEMYRKYKIKKQDGGMIETNKEWSFKAEIQPSDIDLNNEKDYVKEHLLKDGIRVNDFDDIRPEKFYVEYNIEHELREYGIKSMEINVKRVYGDIRTEWLSVSDNVKNKDVVFDVNNENKEWNIVSKIETTNESGLTSVSFYPSNLEIDFKEKNILITFKIS